MPARGKLRLICPHDAAGASEIRQRPAVAAVNVIRSDAVGFRNTCGKMVIRYVELYRGKLLERVFAPVHIKMELREIQLLPCHEPQREERFGVRHVGGIVNRFLLFVCEVFANFHGDRRRKAVAVQQRAALQALGFGGEIQIYAAVAIVVVHRDRRAEILVAVPLHVRGIEIRAFKCEHIQAADRVVIKI